MSTIASADTACSASPVAAASRFEPTASDYRAWRAAVEMLLRCPLSGQRLRFADGEELAALRERVDRGALRRRDGRALGAPLEDALLTVDGACAYAVVEGIVLITAPAALALRGEADARVDLRSEKLAAQTFYDEHGWRPRGDDAYADSAFYEDLRPLPREYLRRCNRRIRQFIPPAGAYLVDVASGPIQFPEYLEYSENYAYRVCVDLSFVALREARRRLGGRGIFLLADVTNLPIEDGAVDAVVSIHTLFHVPQEEQATAFRELHRIVRSGGSAVVVYTVGDHCPLMKLPLMRWRWSRKLGNRLRWYGKRIGAAFGGKLDAEDPHRPRLYFHAHPCRWWTRQKWGFDVETRCWRALHVYFMKRYVHRWLGGAALLRLVAWAEERWPYFFGRIGQYPMFIIRK